LLTSCSTTAADSLTSSEATREPGELHYEQQP
jgi:hypothetical protein